MKKGNSEIQFYLYKINELLTKIKDIHFLIGIYTMLKHYVDKSEKSS